MVTTSKLININVNNAIFIIYISKRFNKIKIINIFDKLFYNLFKVLWICVYQFDFVFCRNKYEPHSELSDKNIRLSYRFIFPKLFPDLYYIYCFWLLQRIIHFYYAMDFSALPFFFMYFWVWISLCSFPSIFTQKIPQKTILLKIWIVFWKLKNSYML